MKYDSRHDRTEPLDPPRRILFHINDFGKGGTETSLLAWLKTLDRQLFAPSVCVTYPTDELLSGAPIRFPTTSRFTCWRPRNG